MANEIYHRSNWGNAVNDIAWGDTYEKFDATNEMFVRSDNYENSNETDKLMAAINPKPSILLTPTAYDNGLLNSVKPVSGENFFPYSNNLTTWNGAAMTRTFVDDLINPSNVLGGSKLSQNSSGGYAWLSRTFTGNETLSAFVKKDSSNFVRLFAANNTVYFDIVNGTIETQVGSDITDKSIINYGNGWFRISMSVNSTAASYVRIYPASSGSSSSGTNSLFVYGAQLERGSKASTYTPTNGTAIKNGSFDFTRGSSATRVNEQGLIEDVQILSGELVQNGDFEQIGSELITNGDFATDLSGWTTTGTNATNTITWEQGGARIISTDANISIRQLNILTIGKAYKLTCDVNVTTGSLGLDGSIIVGSTINFVNGFNEIYFVATSTTFKIKRTISVSNCLLDNVSVKEVGQNWTVNNSDANNFVVFDGSTARLKFLNTSPVTQLVTSFIMTAGKKYKLTVDVALVTSGSIKIDGNGISETFNTSGITTKIINPTGSTAIKFYRASADVDITLNSVSLIEITDDTDIPRIDYTDGTGSLLLEPQSTNLLPYSEDFSFWSSNEVTTQTGFLAPDGSSNATKVVSTGSNSYIVKSGGVFGNYARTIYAKTVSGTGTLQLLSHNTNTNNSFTITENWQRFELNSTAEIASNFYAVDFRGSSTLSEVIIWGAQAENLSYATSYIPTSGSTVTRDAEVCNNSGSSDLINSTEGVFYAEIAALDNDGTNRSISISDGTDANRIELRLATTDDRIQYNARTSSVTQASIFTDSYDVLSFNKIALLYKDNDFRLFVNGTKVATDTSGTAPTGLKELAFDLGDGSNDFYGKVKSVAIFKEALNNDQLERLTGEGYETFNLLAQANNYTII
jgi:hypothetical protein